jgi:DNA polymerase-3 subunit delta'
MARATQAETAEETRELPGERLRWADVPWLAAPRDRLGAARHEGRLPHALLLHGTEGAGQSSLAVWAAQLFLCERRGPAPCGHCGSCVLFLAGNHPDFRSTRVEEKASYIKVDQVRELCTVLSMRSYRGGAKVGIIDPADRMNINATNALLKTLEEPPEETILVLVASRMDRLARTIISRCQRVRVVPPATAAALDWLAAQEARPDWEALLALSAGAPLKALELASAGVGDLAGDMYDALSRPGGSIDPLGLAEAWSKDRPASRLAWLEWWLETSLRRAFAVSDGVNNNRDNSLPMLRTGTNMKAVFALLDRVRDARALLEGSLNTQLLFEDLLVGVVETLAGGIAARPEAEG